MTKVREEDTRRADVAHRARPEAIEAASLFFELLTAHKAAMAGVAREFELTLQQVAALRHLDPAAGISMGTMAEALSCDAANVTGLVDKLEARGLAKRAASPDRRVKLLELTPLGERTRTRILARLHEPTPWIDGLSRDDLRALRDILRKALAIAGARN